jgi:hypothetical protein
VSRIKINKWISHIKATKEDYLRSINPTEARVEAK